MCPRKFLRGCLMHRVASYLSAAILAILAIVIVTVPPAHSDEASHARIVRLSFVEGDVAFQSPGSPWQRAMMNLPIEQDFSLRTDSGFAEVEFEAGLMVRLAPNTQVDFTDLGLTGTGVKVTSLKLEKGTIITTTNLSHSDQVSIAAGDLAITVPRSGRFRIDATDSQNFVTAFHGKVEVASGPTTTEVESGKTLHFDPSAEDTLSLDRSSQPDSFDKWVAQRDDAQQVADRGAGDFISQKNYAFNVGDLYNYGLWSNISGFGMAWQPYGVDSLWMPFGNGMWMYGDPGFGWMWTSYEPWGWLPYHYGGWVNLAGAGWFWIPQNLAVFKSATADFVNVGNQFGWTPSMASVANQNRIKALRAAQTQVCFAGAASHGVILPGMRGQVTPSGVLQSVSAPPATYTQGGAPAVSTLVASGVKVTGRAPVRAVNSVLAYTPHGTVAGMARSNNGRQTPTPMNTTAPRAQGQPPVAFAPHSSPAPVVRAPSTFANRFSDGRISGVTPMGSGASSGGGYRGPSASAGMPGGAGAGGSNSGASSHGATGSSGAPAAPAASGSSSGSGAVHH